MAKLGVSDYQRAAASLKNNENVREIMCVLDQKLAYEQREDRWLMLRQTGCIAAMIEATHMNISYEDIVKICLRIFTDYEYTMEACPDTHVVSFETFACGLYLALLKVFAKIVDC